MVINNICWFLKFKNVKPECNGTVKIISRQNTINNSVKKGNVRTYTYWYKLSYNSYERNFLVLSSIYLFSLDGTDSAKRPPGNGRKGIHGTGTVPVLWGTSNGTVP